MPVFDLKSKSVDQPYDGSTQMPSWLSCVAGTNSEINEEIEKSQKIDERLKEDQQQWKNTHRLLLLG